MSTPLIATKLYIPPPRPNIVLRRHLIERLNKGLHSKLTLVSAPAGFGKTTLLTSWLAEWQKANHADQSLLSFKVAWLSLDEGDSEPARFLAYLVAALQTIMPHIGHGVLGALQAPQPPPIDIILTTLLNEIAPLPGRFVLVLDDYHSIDAKPVDAALTFLLEHLPPQFHLVIATREDPQLPVARLRARNQLTEVRIADLRFTHSEATGFLNEVMGLELLEDDVAALEARTEGWIAGLQLAAISMQGHTDTTSFITSFTGSHRFVQDYLVEEVLQQQSESVQTFLLHTSILDRLCGPLCDTVLEGQKAKGKRQNKAAEPVLVPSQDVLEYLEQANLFLVPLDNERRWYRYHHLFADLLRQRLHQSAISSHSIAELHKHASLWYEEHGLEIEAFHHAVAAHDIEHAARLVEGKGMPLFFRGAVAPVLNWLTSLPTTVFDARPSLWVMYASALLFAGQLTSIEPKLQAVEAALQNASLDEQKRDLIGHIASIRATLAVTQHNTEAILDQSRRALEYLNPGNLPVRTATTWTLGYAYHLQGERAAATKAYTEAIATSQAIGHPIITIMATIGLGNMQEANNQLHLAAQSYQHVLQLIGDTPLAIACEANLGLARIYYEWNDLDAAQHNGQQSLQQALQVQSTDRSIASEIFLARLKLTHGDASSAANILAKAEQRVQEDHFIHRLPDLIAAQVLVLLRQGDLAVAAELAQTHTLPISQARVHLAHGDPSAALALLEPLRQHVEAKGWEDERLKLLILQALAHYTHGDHNSALQLLEQALVLAEPGGFIRTFIDEGRLMTELLAMIKNESRSAYVHTLLAAFGTQKDVHPSPDIHQSLVEPLSQRELEILRLIAQGLSNHEISERLYLALSTVKGHNLKIFGKLAVQRRTEAVARARELGLL